jgi:predicted transposase/invertase (TIGR01784 family)
MEKYKEDKIVLDPKNDVVFQKIFGSPENEDILISFLNALMKGTEKDKIGHVEYVDTKLSDIDALDDKIGILDIRVITESGTHINVEIQLINRYNMINRTLFYWSRLYYSQIKKSENYKSLNRTVTINILNFDFLNSKNYHTAFHLYEDKELTKLTDLLEIQFVEIPKFLKAKAELDNSLNIWLTFLTEPEKEVMEVLRMENSAINKAITVLDTLSRDPDTVRLAELRMKKLLDEKSMMEGAKEEGEIEGVLKGKIEGKIEAKEEDAISFLKLGVSEEIISKGTGLNIEKIKELKEKLLSK